MYSPTFDKHIDIQQDKNAIVEYCTKYWTVKENQEQFAKMVSFLFDYGVKLGTNHFNSSEFSIAAHKLVKVERELMKKKLAEGDESAMDLYYVKSDVALPNHTLERLLKDGIEYNTYMPKLLKFIKNEYFQQNVLSFNLEELNKALSYSYIKKKYDEREVLYRCIGKNVVYPMMFNVIINKAVPNDIVYQYADILSRNGKAEELNTIYDYYQFTDNPVLKLFKNTKKPSDCS